jgi:hypothetical protein
VRDFSKLSLVDGHCLWGKRKTVGGLQTTERDKLTSLQTVDTALKQQAGNAPGNEGNERTVGQGKGEGSLRHITRKEVLCADLRCMKNDNEGLTSNND